MTNAERDALRDYIERKIDGAVSRAVADLQTQIDKLHAERGGKSRAQLAEFRRQLGLDPETTR